MSADLLVTIPVGLDLAGALREAPEPCPHLVAVLLMAADHYEPADAGEES